MCGSGQLQRHRMRGHQDQQAAPGDLCQLHLGLKRGPAVLQLPLHCQQLRNALPLATPGLGIHCHCQPDLPLSPNSQRTSLAPATCAKLGGQEEEWWPVFRISRRQTVVGRYRARLLASLSQHFSFASSDDQRKKLKQLLKINDVYVWLTSASRCCILVR